MTLTHAAISSLPWKEEIKRCFQHTMIIISNTDGEDVKKQYLGEEREREMEKEMFKKQNKKKC